MGWNELAKLTEMETSSIGMFHNENVIDKPLPNKGFQWASRYQSFFKVRHKSNGESNHHFSSHSNYAVSLNEVFFIKLF